MSPTSSPTSSYLSTAARAGLVTALATWALVALPALVGWVSAPQSSLAWWSGLAVGSGIWFLSHGQPIGGPGIAVSTTPVLLLGVFVVIAFRVARRLVLGARAAARRSEWDAIVWRALVPGYLLGYAVAAAVFAGFTLAGSVHPDPTAIAGTLLVPVLGLSLVLVRPGEQWTPAAIDRQLGRLPDWAIEAWRAGWRGALLLLGAGLALALLRVLVSLGAVLHIQGLYGAGLVAGLVLALAQLAFLGNVATWGLAFLAGPGFSVAVDGLVSPAGAHPGLMPLIPILGALPSDATYGGAMWLVLAVPVVLGGVIGRLVDRLLGATGTGPDGSAQGAHGWRDRAGAMAAACGVSVVIVVLVTALANGAVGVERLSAVGVAIWPLAGCLLAEVLLGAATWLGIALYRERTAPPAPVEATPQSTVQHS